MSCEKVQSSSPEGVSCLHQRDSQLRCWTLPPRDVSHHLERREEREEKEKKVYVFWWPLRKCSKHQCKSISYTLNILCVLMTQHTLTHKHRLLGDFREFHIISVDMRGSWRTWEGARWGLLCFLKNSLQEHFNHPETEQTQDAAIVTTNLCWL